MLSNAILDTENTDRENRLFFLDNLRTFIIFLVVVYHAGWVYEKSGFLSSVWIVDDLSKNNLAGILNLILDMFMMPTMFFISGYFAPVSLKRKTGLAFLTARFKRIMIPWILAVFTLLPLYKVIYLYSRNLPQENIFTYFHFNGGILINQGWLWFLPVLFLFDVLYLYFTKMNPKKLKFLPAVSIVFLVSFAYSCCMSIFELYGWTKTILLDFQNERILIYFMVFLIGALSYHSGIFSQNPAGKKRYYFVCATIWIPMNVYVVFLLNLVFNPGNYIISGFIDVAVTWFGFHLSLLGLMYIIINTFRYYFNREGKLAVWLNSCSFGVYIVHFIVVGVIATVLLCTDMPSLVKYALLIATTYAVSNLMVYFYKFSFPKARNRV